MPPAPITIEVPGSGSGNATLVSGQQLIINFTETISLCYTSTAPTNLFTNSPFPAPGSRHLGSSQWSGTAIEVSAKQTIQFWTSTNGICEEVIAGTHRSITIGSVQAEQMHHSVTVGSTS